MRELSAAEYHIVDPIFREIEHSVAIVYAVIEGNSPGRVFVDDLPAPRSAFLFPEGTFFYVAGDENDAGFCQSFSNLLFAEILPNAVEKEMVLFSFTDAWKQRLDSLLAGKGVMRIQRKVFDFNLAKFLARRQELAGLPAGLFIRPIDQDLVDRYPVYRSLVDPASRRFGYCLMNGDEIVSECQLDLCGGW